MLFTVRVGHGFQFQTVGSVSNDLVVAFGLDHSVLTKPTGTAPDSHRGPGPGLIQRRLRVYLNFGPLKLEADGLGAIEAAIVIRPEAGICSSPVRPVVKSRTG